MIVRCDKCGKRFDDAYRFTICPHGTFAANDGQNNFAHHPESFLEGRRESQIRVQLMWPWDYAGKLPWERQAQVKLPSGRLLYWSFHCPLFEILCFSL